MSTTGITVHVKQEHLCGQVHEVVYHMSEGAVSAGIKFPPLMATENTFEIVEPVRELEFSGSYNKVELSGVEWEDHRVVCKGCKQDLIYGLIAEDT